MARVNEHGFEVFKDSKNRIEATARISPSEKYVFYGRCTFERKWTEKYGWQVIISVWMDEYEYPKFEVTDYLIKRGRIEICIPEVCAIPMRLIKRRG